MAERREVVVERREEEGMSKAIAVMAGIIPMMIMIVFMAMMFSQLIPTPAPPQYTPAEIDVDEIIGGD